MVQNQQLSRGWRAVSLASIPVTKHQEDGLRVPRRAYSKASLKSLGWWPLGQGLTAPTCLEGAGLSYSAPGQGPYGLNGQLPQQK